MLSCRRIRKELRHLDKHPLPGISFGYRDHLNENPGDLEAMILGPKNTPYEVAPADHVLAISWTLR